MSDYVPEFRIEPYIKNGHPQWLVKRVYQKPKGLFSWLDSLTYYSGECVVCVVDTREEAEALIAHIKKPAVTVD